MKTTFFFIIFVCLSLTSCLENKERKMHSYIPESKAIITVGEHEWYYLISPTGRCYETTIRVELSGTNGYGFLGMWLIPCDEVPEHQLIVMKNSQ